MKQADRPALVRTMLALSLSAEAWGMPDLARLYQVQAVIIARATYRDLPANT